MKRIHLLKRLHLTTCALAMSLALPSLALAQSPKGSAPANGLAAELSQANAYLGVNLGYADPSGVNGRLGWGLEGGMILINGIMTELFWRSSEAKQDGTNVRVDHYGLGADISLANYVPGPLAGLRGGVKLGVSNYRVAGTNTDTEFAYGPSLGYDFWNFGYGVSVGGTVDYMISGGPQQPTTLYILANLKYGF